VSAHILGPARLAMYRTRSNNVRKFRTPGGRLSVQYIAKRAGPRICADTRVELHGIGCHTKTKFKNLPKRKRTVTRAYGGSLSAEAVRHRILRAFFNDELRVIKQGANQAKRTTKRKQGGQRKK